MGRSINKFKVRLVAKGFTQIEGIDYQEIFSHAMRFASPGFSPFSPFGLRVVSNGGKQNLP